MHCTFTFACSPLLHDLSDHSFHRFYIIMKLDREFAEFVLEAKQNSEWTTYRVQKLDLIVREALFDRQMDGLSHVILSLGKFLSFLVNIVIRKFLMLYVLSKCDMVDRMSVDLDEL